MEEDQNNNAESPENEAKKTNLESQDDGIKKKFQKILKMQKK